MKENKKKYHVVVIQSSPNEIKTWNLNKKLIDLDGIVIHELNFYNNVLIRLNEELIKKADAYLIFNDISYLSCEISIYCKKNNVCLIMLQEGSTDFIFNAIKNKNLFNILNIKKMVSYLFFSFKINGFNSLIRFFSYYLKEGKKKPYGFGCKKDIFIFNNVLEMNNFCKKAVKQKIKYYSLSDFNVSYEIMKLDFLERAVIIEQPIFERFGDEAYFNYYMELKNKIFRLGVKSLEIKFHPRTGLHKKKKLLKLLNDAKEISEVKNNSLICGYSSTLLFELALKKYNFIFVFTHELPEPDNISYKLLKKNNLNHVSSLKNIVYYRLEVHNRKEISKIKMNNIIQSCKIN